MKLRRSVAGILVCASIPVYMAAQSGRHGTSLQVASAAPNVPLRNPALPKAAPPPRNADGHPDLNGMWDFLTGTPVQRPPEFGDRLFMRSEEAAAFFKNLKAAGDTDVRDTENVERDAYTNGMNNAGFDYA